MDLKQRKAEARVCVKNKSGTVLKNARIKFEQKNHAFLFGCGAFDSLAYIDSQNDEQKNAFFAERMQKWLELFNYATLPFYWGGYEPVEGHKQIDVREKAAIFLQKNGVVVKGHPLCWHTGCAPWLLKYDNETILQKQLERIVHDVTFFKGKIDIWDVINEVVIMPIFDRYDNAITRICKDKGRAHLVQEVFASAKEANPNGIFLINDFNTSVAYEILIESCLELGVPISAIGIQSHQHQGYWGKEKLEEVLKRFEKFALPLHFTENTFVSGKPIPQHITDLNDFRYEDDASTEEFEELQMRNMEEMYRILFSHPLVSAITNWDFTDGAWLNAPSGVLHKDNSIKPVYSMLHHLIKEEWHTSKTLCTDENGFAILEGFKGTYSASLANCNAQADNDGKVENCVEFTLDGTKDLISIAI